MSTKQQRNATASRRKRLRNRREKTRRLWYWQEQRIAQRRAELAAGLGREPSAVEHGMIENTAVLEIQRDELIDKQEKTGADMADRVLERTRLLLSYYRLLGVAPQEQEGPRLADVLGPNVPALSGEAEAQVERESDSGGEIPEGATSPPIDALPGSQGDEGAA